MAVKIKKGVPYTGTLPAVLTGTKDGYLHRYKIYGNMEQTGVPTPENPVEPQECGERTENRFDFNRQRSDTFVLDTTKYIYGARADNPATEPQYISQFVYNNDSFTVLTRGGAAGIGFLVKVNPNTTYTVLFQCDITVPATGTSVALNLITSNGTFGTYWAIYGDDRVSTFTTNADTAYVYLVFRVYRLSATYSNIMLVEGSTAPSSFIPYGYKLPLLSGSTPVDVYLGESQTTRRIKKLVLTGWESWGKSSARTGSFYLNMGTNAIATLGLCDRAINVGTIGQYDSIGKMFVEPSGLQRVLNVWLFDTNLSLDDFKTYLQQQYTNGTPVTVWYVLATEQTGTLNEPLRKIGDYSDTIDSTQTTAQIPSSADSTTISWAGEGLAPSQFDSIAEWVNASPKIYTNGAWVDAQTYTYTNGAWVADN